MEDKAAAQPPKAAQDVSVAAAASGVAMDAAAFGLPFVLNFWKEFDLEATRTTMDEQGLKVAENQESSTKNRRKLAESTKEFRKTNVAEQPKLFVALLKAYQEEVDNLTKRAKFGESAFLGLYQKLYEAPDPVPALASASEVATKVAELNQENRKMKAELDEFRTESTHLKNQQATVRRLEERNKHLEQLMEEKVKEMVAMKQQVLAEESQKSLDALKEREDALQEQLRVARDSVENMKRLHEMGQSQLFEVKARSEEERESKQYEVNLLTDEVERAQARLLSLEREKEALKAQLKEVGSSNKDSGGDVDSESTANLQHTWEAAVRAKEAVISELHGELHAIETSAAAEREQHLHEVKHLHSIVQSKEDEIEELRSELNGRPSKKQWDDLRRQVKILQAVGYNAVEVDDWEEAPGGSEGRLGQGEASKPRGGEMGRLEALLLEKNRRMEHELTQAKVQLNERAEAAALLERAAEELKGKVEEQQKLIVKLEDDILKGSSKQGSDRTSGPRGPGDPLSNIVGSREPRSGLLAVSGSSPVLGIEEAGAEEEGSADSVLAVVCAQRDRFRQRLSDLDEELRVANDKLARANAEVERLKADNVKLYERIRYVQQYAGSAHPGPADKSHSRARKHVGDLEAGSDVEQKYKKMYEDGLNPFAAFSSKERELRYKELGLRDWIALTSGKFLLSNKHARTFVFFYSIALHLLVFFSMYKMSHYSHQSAKYGGAHAVRNWGSASLHGPSMALRNLTSMDDGRLPSL